jgi:hypothetical protein
MNNDNNNDRAKVRRILLNPSLMRVRGYGRPVSLALLK